MPPARHRRTPSTICPWAAFLPTRQECRPGPGSHARGAPHGEPPGEVLLDLQVVGERVLDLYLERVVPLLAGQRGERVERPPLVQVDEREPALALVPEGHQRAQQLR